MTGQPRSDKPSLRPQPKRDGVDFWPTPEPERRSLLHVLRLDPALAGLPVWECAAGNGALVDAMRGAGRDVLATDIEPQRIDITALDFLRDPPPTSAANRIVATNQPFRRTDEFMRRCWSLMRSKRIAGFVLLLRSDALFTSNRAPWLSGASAIWAMPWRTRWIADSVGNPRWSFAWVVWTASHRGPPVMMWLTGRRRERMVTERANAGC